MEKIESIFVFGFNLLIFVLATIVFLPAFLIVNFMQNFWTKKLSDLFGF
jgi:hypothetical protein